MNLFIHQQPPSLSSGLYRVMRLQFKNLQLGLAANGQWHMQLSEDEKREELMTGPSNARERLRKTRDMDSAANGPQLGDGLAGELRAPVQYMAMQTCWCRPSAACACRWPWCCLL